MRYVSTRGKAPPVSFSEAVTASLAPDGGLYVPEKFPTLSRKKFLEAETFARGAEVLLAPYLEGDPLGGALAEICGEAFDFPVPLHVLSETVSLLELFHGPTAAFKDFGARFLAGCLARQPSERARTVLVATSGDTGGAVAAAFHGKPGIDVVILFPRGRVSSRQEKQLTAWGDNVRAFAVEGTFDDCQRMVKEAFADAPLRAERQLLSANSINIGRLLPQQAYYAVTSIEYQKRTKRVPGFIVPTGNVGNSVAAFYVRHLSFPVREILMVANANRAVPDFFLFGKVEPRPTIDTLANAMDVGNPSNMERLFHLFGTSQALRADSHAVSISDEKIRETIRKRPFGQILCPHTATAFRALEEMRGRDKDKDWILVATAHPAKFDTVVEPLIGEKVPIPPPLAAILERTSSVTRLEPTLTALKQKL